MEYLGAAYIALYRPCLPYPINARMTYMPLQHLFLSARAQLSQKVHLFEVKTVDFSRTHRYVCCCRLTRRIANRSALGEIVHVSSDVTIC